MFKPCAGAVGPTFLLVHGICWIMKKNDTTNWPACSPDLNHVMYHYIHRSHNVPQRAADECSNLGFQGDPPGEHSLYDQGHAKMF